VLNTSYSYDGNAKHLRILKKSAAADLKFEFHKSKLRPPQNENDKVHRSETRPPRNRKPTPRHLRCRRRGLHRKIRSKLVLHLTSYHPCLQLKLPDQILAEDKHLPLYKVSPRTGVSQFVVFRNYLRRKMWSTSLEELRRTP